jgi:hypothetical protein
MIPQPPKKKEIIFNDPDFHQQKKEFNKQIRKIIVDFSRTIPRSQNRDSILKFLDCINPGKSSDTTRLPYIGRGKNAASKNKIACVFALISWVIRRYWVYLNNPKYKNEIEDLVKQLQQIHSDSLDKYKIEGDLASGFYLARNEQ